MLMRVITPLALCLVLFSTSAKADLISEFEPNPVGGDPANQTVELTGTANSAFDWWILSIESDNVSTLGAIDRATQVTGNFDADGFAIVDIPDLENPSFTVLLVSDFTGSIGDDIDSNDDGVIDDFSLWGGVEDGLGVPDSDSDIGNLYAAQVGGVDLPAGGLDGGGTEPELVFREGTTGTWIAVYDLDSETGPGIFDQDGNQYSVSDFDIDPTIATYGGANPNFSAIPEPSHVAALSVVAFGLCIGRIRRRFRKNG